MVIIRLTRKGSKKRPFYNIVVADNRFPRDGRYLENVGFFNPVSNSKDKIFFVYYDRIEYWVLNGAQFSNRVRSLINKFKS